MFSSTSEYLAVFDSVIEELLSGSKFFIKETALYFERPETTSDLTVGYHLEDVLLALLAKCREQKYEIDDLHAK